MDNEKELKDLTERVIAAGGRVGVKSGNFTLGIVDAEGYKRGDEHCRIAGLFFWVKYKNRGTSRWMSWMALERARGGQAEFNKVYQKEYREGNKERLSEYHKDYRELNKERLSENSKRYREENKEAIAEYLKGYYEGNKDRIAEYQKEYREENKDRIAEKGKEWREENPDKARANNARRRARLREALDPSANKAIVDSRYEAATYLSDVTGIDWHVDHTQPLKHGGKHREDNLQVVPSEWNSSKGARHNNRWEEDSDRYRLATAVEKRFEREAIAAQGA